MINWPPVLLRECHIKIGCKTISFKSKLGIIYFSQGCAEPDFKGPIDKDLDAQAQGQWKNVTNWWESLDTDKRHCVIAEVRGDFKEKLQECIDKKIPGFSLPGPSADSVRDPPHIKKDK